MIRILLTTAFLASTFTSYAQDELFTFGQVTYKELDIGEYEKDTNAVALVLKETGHAYVDNGNNYNLIYRYYAKIKILKTAGLEQANVTIPLYRNGAKTETLRNVKASSFSIENGSMAEAKLVPRNVFTENYKHGNLKKFTIPNVTVGSVIEYEYEVETPFFLMNFKPWEFQSELPKLSSEYWASIPANYRYNISLRGFLKLSKDESEIMKGCFSIGGGVADCVRYKWAMTDIPAFVEEEYMTAKKNFLSAIRFELMQIEYFDGRKDRVTKEWKDADQELRMHERFGTQLKKGKDVTDTETEQLLKNETDPIKKANIVYTAIRRKFRWDGEERLFSEEGIKKAYDKGIGNSADINLSLVAALRHAGLEADPLILSTRDNGMLTDLFPVLTEFNYVVAKLDIAGKSYLLDATDDFLPFGILPERCLNEKGRVMAKKESYWHEIKATEKAKQVTTVNLKVGEKGEVMGSIHITYMGYKAGERRNKIYSFSNPDDYIRERKAKWSQGSITSVEISHLEDFSKPLVEKLNVEMEPMDIVHSQSILFNPFLIDKVTRNPFRSAERLFPVDFGTPLEEVVVINLHLPEGLVVDEIPERVGIALPNSGGRYIFDVQQNGNVLSVNTMLSINRTVFSSVEYHYLKELFNKVISVNRMDLVLKRI